MSVDAPPIGGQAGADPIGRTAVLSDEEIGRLVGEHEPMAIRLARRYSNGPAVDPDLVQVANLGLFLAASRFDPTTGPFRPFAMVTVLGELKKYLRANGWAAKVPRRIQEATITVSNASERLQQDLKRSPTPAEVAAETGLSVETVLVALQARNARFAGGDEGVDSESADTSLNSVEATIDMRRATAQLSPESRDLLAMRFDQEMTQRQIADRLDISQSAVHRRLSIVLSELRDVLDPENGTQA